VDVLLEDLLGGLLGDLLDLDSTFRTDHQHQPLARAIEDDAQVELADDLEALLDENAPHDLPGRPRLVGDEVHAEDLRGGRLRLGRPLDHLDAAALAAAPGVNLCLDDDGAPAEPLGHARGVLRLENDFTLGHGDAMLRQDGFGLIFVNLHPVRSYDIIGI
jgi:hypothetical protein